MNLSQMSVLILTVAGPCVRAFFSMRRRRRFVIEQARKMARRVCADSGECRLRRQATREQCVRIEKLHNLLKRWLVCQEESAHYSVVDGEPKLVALSKNYTPSNVCW